LALVAAPPLAGCSVTGAGAWQQLQVQGGQGWPETQAGQAHPHPPPEPEPPPSGVTELLIRAQLPVGHGVVMHSMLSEVQPQESPVSATQEAASVCAVHGSAGVVPHPQGAQAELAGQAGQPQTDTGAEPPSVTTADAVPVAAGVRAVIVVAEPLEQAQLQAGQASPAGHSGQLQVQVPVPTLPPAVPPAPVPQPPPEPPDPPPPPPSQLQSQGGQVSPGPHAGQEQVQVPPPDVAWPPSTTSGGGQSHWTAGHGRFDGQTSGCRQWQALPAAGRS